MKHFCRIIGLTVLLAMGTRAERAAYAQPALMLDPTKAITQYPLDVWEIEDGLPQNTVNAITQTSDGYLWLGTQEGLVRFDGLRFTIYDQGNSALANNNITALYEDQQGFLWIGTRSGGLTSHRDGTFTTYTAADGLGSNEVTAIVEAPEGQLWVGTTDDGLTRFHRGRWDHFNTEEPLRVNVLYVDHRGQLWIGTRGNGLTRFVLDEATGAVVRFNTFTTADGLPDDDITALHEDARGNLWIGMRGNGLARIALDDVTGLIDHVTPFTSYDGLPSNQVNALFGDRAGSLWIGTNGYGISRLYDGGFTAFDEDDGLSGNIINAFYEDREGSLWIGTGSGGLNRLWKGKVVNYTLREGLGSENVYAIYQAPDSAIWLGSMGGGVTRYKGGRFDVFDTDDGLASDNFLSISGTADGAIWLGSYGQGLTRLALNDSTGAVEQATTYTADDGLIGNTIFALYTDSKDVLWIGTEAGVNRYDGRAFDTLTTRDGLSSNFPTVFTESRDGSMWIGTYDGGLNQYKDGAVTAHYTPADSLDTNFVLALHEDRDGYLWVSIRYAGLYRLKDGELAAYTMKNGLFSDGIQQILEDGNRNLWMSSNKGLFRVSLDELHAFAADSLDAVTSVAFTRSDGLTSREFNGGFQPAGWRAHDGHLWFPTNRGAVEVDPDQLSTNEQPPPILLQAAFSDGTPIPLSGEILLEPGSKKFEFRYVGLSFIASQRVRYRYWLVGEDEGWVDAGTRRTAFYNNLSPGPYTFLVQAANGDGVWSKEEASLTFELRPFYYQTTWFWSLVAFLVLVGAVSGYQLRVRRLKAHQRELEQTVAERTKDLREEKEKTEKALHETELAHREAERQRRIVEEAKAVIEEQAEQLRQMDRMKTRFFNNISHEFRTPLTLNIGPLESALTGSYGPISPVLRRQLQVMLRNARRLLRLINQLLDLSRLEAGRMTLKARRGNLVDLVEGIVLSFTAFAEDEGLDLYFESESPNISLYYDPHNLEKVFFNLLSNAIKFTPEGGAIYVTVREHFDEGAEAGHQEIVEVEVRDTGHGIPREELPHIFNRFHQVDGTMSRVQEGTGIGLSLVKELVELHGGGIDVESEPGHGTCFTVRLRKGNAHFSQAPPDTEPSAEEEPSRGAMVEMVILDEGTALETTREDEATLLDGATLDVRPTILLVDDNPDIRSYVSSCLDDRFRVVQAHDGLAGLDKAQDYKPDLVISDVMMPRMDGYGLCRALKQDATLNHIPVILLTSRASTENRIEGLEAGADDYLNKPFNARELLARVDNLISLREQQRELKSLNIELSETNQALLEANELKSQLVSIASHDMKNPLMAIREFSRTIKEELDPSSHLVEFLDLIYTSTDQMLHLVTHLLDSAALESGQLQLHKEVIDLGQLARTAAYRNQKQAEAKEQQIVFTYDGQAPLMVAADPNHLYDALENLVSNAIKYSPMGRTIWVDAHDRDGMACVSVRDEGPGLTDDDKQKLFGKFQKLSAKPTGNESSTGLGLSIVKQIMELHKGRVWAESTPGEGSTFVLALPYAEARKQPVEREAQAPPRRPDTGFTGSEA